MTPAEKAEIRLKCLAIAKEWAPALLITSKEEIMRLSEDIEKWVTSL